MDLANPGTLRTLLGRHGIHAAKSRGQHFLVDRSVLSAIVDAAEITVADDVLEVGPGPGVLTRELAMRARSVTAVELDRGMVRVLGETLVDLPNARVVQGDALALDLYGACPRPPTRIVANLPYQITSPLLERFLADPRRAPLVVVLVQAEVARRIVAGPEDGKENGFLSVFVQAFAEPDIVRQVPAGAFQPPPRVESSVVRLRAHARPVFEPLAQEPFFRFVSDVYRHRRKTLATALGHEAGVARDPATRALEGVGIDPRRRPESLSVVEWVALAVALGVPGA